MEIATEEGSPVTFTETTKIGTGSSGSHPLPELNSARDAAAYATAVNRLGIVSITDAKFRIIHANDEFVRISGYSREELVGNDHTMVNSGHHSKEFFRDMHRTIVQGRTWRSIIKNRAKDGSYYWVDALIVPLEDAQKKIIGYLSVRIDVTKSIELHVALQDRTNLLHGIVESFPGGISVFDKDLRLVLCNEKRKEMMDYPPELLASGAPTFENVVRFNAARGEYGVGDIEAFVTERLARARDLQPHVFERQRPNGTHIEIRGMPLPAGGFVTTYLDISQRLNDRETINRLAHHDTLTGLPNRLLFQDRMRQGLARVRRGDTLALLCLDLDRFKSVNDTLGHPVGDQLLVAVAKRLSHCVRETDTVARLGGDEFAVIQASPKSPADVATLAQRIIAIISESFVIGENIINIGTSIGIALSPQDGTNDEQLLQCTDLALYNVKANGRGQFGLFEPQLHSHQAARNGIAAELREALAKNHFEIHYQPIVNIQSRKLVSCEALIRWNHEIRGLVPASLFIPIAEEAGLIGKIGDWVLRKSCEQAAAWPDDISVSVNISPVQLRAYDFVDKVRGALQGMPPSRLVLEITESMIIQDRTATAEIMTRLHDLGVGFALDDFGTGYSSMSYLQHFPFDKIKIDRSFVSGSADKQRAATLRRVIVQLAEGLGMASVAEGVETLEELNELAREGCLEAQGYYFSKAIPAHQLEKMFGRVL